MECKRLLREFWSVNLVSFDFGKSFPSLTKAYRFAQHYFLFCLINLNIHLVCPVRGGNGYNTELDVYACPSNSSAIKLFKSAVMESSLNNELWNLNLYCGFICDTIFFLHFLIEVE